MRLLNGAPVDPDADGCCVGLTGAGDVYALCMTPPTTSGLIMIPETGQFAWTFSCDRHAVVLESPRPLNADDVEEMRRRVWLAEEGTVRREPEPEPDPNDDEL